MRENVSASPLQVLNMARRAVPAVNYALGVAGIAAAGALAALFLGSTKASLVLFVLVLIGMVLLFVFAQLVVAKSESTRIAGAFLMWAVLLFFVSFLFFTVTAFASEWPRPWAAFLGIIPSPPRSDNAITDIPGGTGWIFLGYFDSQSGDFSEEPKAEVIFGHSRVTHHFYEIGETIRLKFPSKVYIVNYSKTKTDRNLIAPIVKGVVSKEDQTGVVLPIGTRLILRDVAYGSWPGNPNEAVWGRVVPADEN